MPVKRKFLIVIFFYIEPLLKRKLFLLDIMYDMWYDVYMVEVKILLEVGKLEQI